MKKLTITLGFMFTISHCFAHMSERQKIDKIIDVIKSSEAIIIEEGNPKTIKKTLQDMEFQYARANTIYTHLGPKRQMSAKTFVRQLAGKNLNGTKRITPTCVK